MRDSAKIVAIYEELRRVVGAKVKASEVLCCAASLVELFSIDEDAPTFNLYEGRQPYDMAPVDIAMADGGWRTLSREWCTMGWENTDSCGGSRSRELMFR
jgi:hypothetical protein